MNVKIDTREKLHAITIQENNLAANMTEKMDNCLLPLLNHNVKNAVINMKDIKKMDKAAAEHLIHLQRTFYDRNASFVVFGLQPNVKIDLEQAGMLAQLNTTPTESEAFDVVMMEEMEREFGEI